MGAGDVWVAVGWSSDIIPYSKRASNISVFAPESGTSLWADLWVRPAIPTPIFSNACILEATWFGVLLTREVANQVKYVYIETHVYIQRVLSQLRPLYIHLS